MRCSYIDSDNEDFTPGASLDAHNLDTQDMVHASNWGGQAQAGANQGQNQGVGIGQSRGRGQENTNTLDLSDDIVVGQNQAQKKQKLGTGGIGSDRFIQSSGTVSVSDRARLIEDEDSQSQSQSENRYHLTMEEKEELLEWLREFRQAYVNYVVCLGDLCSVLLLPYFISSGALGSPDLIPSYSMIILA